MKLSAFMKENAPFVSVLDFNNQINSERGVGIPEIFFGKGERGLRDGREFNLKLIFHLKFLFFVVMPILSSSFSFTLSGDIFVFIFFITSLAAFIASFSD